MTSKLELRDWKEIKRIAEDQIKEANKVLEIQVIILDIADKKIKEFPDDKQELY